jgi:hypothetical protein
VLRLDANPAVHQFHKLFTDGQAQAGAPVMAAGRRVSLGERLKQEAEAGRRNTDAGIGHGAVDGGVGLTLRRTAHTYTHFALVRELDRVVDQVEEDLAEPTRMAGELRGRGRMEVTDEVEAFGRQAIPVPGDTFLVCKRCKRVRMYTTRYGL